jgi:hypothetical protein
MDAELAVEWVRHLKAEQPSLSPFSLATLLII